MKAITMSQATTRVVTVELVAMTRVQYSASVSVPVDATDDEINDLVNAMYTRTDGSDFVGDPDYWERGNCYASASEEKSGSDFRYCRSLTGELLLTPVPKP